MVKRRRLPYAGKRHMKRRMTIINQMTPSEVEYAEGKFGKPISKFTVAELLQEWKAIKSTYPEETW